ncbi:MAG: hypothetical protein COW04_06310 [Deltaproteobacteria bacterium CG12_big_fil_rev_8_21_14_0_65_43_10]|nr:MAG: hypothetical protein AUK23_00475 [Deltaproteobacteria bacterium CG2_30_43_15]PIQ45673.1 MAG: hypothetical protein COW04_06310 [Deltaproteobacteria bacterium CG12_big_fil_rev_8_21_14_0_65_43_10]PIU86023.1 MAG: hypothetical protein COS67_04660 [Deltaproteobacteria bacterium CG06_land_8_20_14_3_00_44_19]PIX26681.1 MAG: hypothetical protein COZ68_00525 [Deltaproteobacteria bacterium CG_4_8_14_3_um_filter_43_13]PIZ18524.1 MAG: hypothetical protein COY50_14895 [Deltaproteobacteria bacterium C
MKKKKNPKSNLLAYQAEKALKEAVAEAIVEHKRKGIPIVVWRDGKVVEIAPEQIEVREPQSEYIPSEKKSDSLPPLRGKVRMGGRKGR